MDIQSAKPFAVVTGATGGIGRELAKQFARNGFDLLITATGPRIDEVARDLEPLGACVQTVQADLATHDGAEALYRAIGEAGRPVDAVAINAGVIVGGDFATQTDLADELRMIALNVTGTVHLAKRVLPDMVARGAGKVLFTSSIVSLMPGPFEAVYNATKAFVQSFSQALRNELKDSGVTITALQPGPTQTDLFHRGGMDDTRVGVAEREDPALIAAQGFDALMAGRDHVIAGSPLTKAAGALAKVLPDAANARIHRLVSEPGKAKR